MPKYVMQDTLTGEYLKSYDVEAFDGRGSAVFTRYISEAMQFDNSLDAMSHWRRQSKTHPVRPDGKPNRPLTAFTMTIKPMEEPSS